MIGHLRARLRRRDQTGAAVMTGLVFYVGASSLGLVALLSMTFTSSRIAASQELDAQLLRATDGALATAVTVLRRDPTAATSTPIGDGRCAAPLGDGEGGRLDVDDGLGPTVSVSATCDKGSEVGTSDVRLTAVASVQDGVPVLRGTARVAVTEQVDRRIVEVLDWNLRPGDRDPDAPPTTVVPTTTTTLLGDDVTWKLTVTADWTVGYCADVVVTNPARRAVTWKVTVPVDGAPYSFWNGVWSQDGSELHVKGEPWNHVITPGSSTNFGFCANRPATTTTTPAGQEVATADLTIASDWKAGYCAEVRVTNPSRERLSWVVTVPVEGELYAFWNGTYGRDGDRLTVKGADWNSSLDPGASTSFGFCSNR